MKRQTPDDRHGTRLRALIVVLWRGGLRVQEALALAERSIAARSSWRVGRTRRAAIHAEMSASTGPRQSRPPGLTGASRSAR